ncbi:MAG: hypothetical protein BBJ57_02120 [Desulfobacterales bacterium PC51MH44]|nr:MAG: hypothetical protein BBJ57_02120 [Desulfobacterales bacterium PC51MH44]
MKTKLLILLIGFVFFPISFVSGEMYDYVTYFDYTEKSEVFKWDADNAEYYKFKLHHVEKDIDVAMGTTTQSQVRIHYPRSGHYIHFLKACTTQIKDDDGNDLCSEWVDSTDPEYAKVNGEAQAWWVYRYLSPPGPIIIE